MPTANKTLTLVVVGANGFVGGTLLQEASSHPEISVRAQARSQASILKSANIVRVCGSLEQIHPDLFPRSPHILIHVAGKNTDKDGTGYEHVNVRGTANLLAHCNTHTRGIIYHSSLSVLGQGKQSDVSANATQSPETPLACSRAQAETLVLQKAKELGISAYCLRPRFILGQGDAFVLPALQRLASKGLRIGNGSQKFSVIDVNDYANLILQLSTYIDCSNHAEQMALNIGYDQPLSFSSIYQTLLEFDAGRQSKYTLRHPAIAAKLLGYLPFEKFQSLATQLQLIGLDHYGDVSQTSARLQTDLLSRDSHQYFRDLVQNIKDSPCN